MIRFSLVCPFYNVEPYVDGFLSSVIGQSFDPVRIQVVLVDDGSTDGTSEVLDRWCAEHPTRLELVRQSNGGPSRARNAGLELCRGEWVLFPDPDDRLPEDYLEQLDAFLEREEAASVDIVATRRIIRDEARGSLKDTHPLKSMFESGDRVVPTTRSTQEFVLAVNSGAVRRSALVETGLRFDPEVRPTFEDAMLVGRVLLARQTPLGICAGATYEWTRRAVTGSITQLAWTKPERYDHIFRVGYLRLLEEARSTLGAVPDWVARMVLYDLQWYLRVDRKEPSPLRDLEGPVVARLEAHFASALALMEPYQIVRFDLCPDERILAALRSFVEPRVHSSPTVSMSREGETTIEYDYFGERPTEEVSAGGRFGPRASEESDVMVFGRPRLRRRTLHCEIEPEATDIRLRLDGIEHRLRRPDPPPRRKVSAVVTRFLRGLRRSPAPGRPSSR